jgi:ABC-2 type transport system ATP-binding protein
MVMADNVLWAQGVRKRLARRGVLDEIDLEVGPGEIVGIMGENGAGKSTLIRILAGVLRPDSGEIARPVGGLGYAPQVPLLYEQLTLREHFQYVAAARGLPVETWRERSEQLFATYRFLAWADHRVNRVSGGTMQKLNLSLALLADPAILLLDEPYGGFEWETYLRFWQHVKDLRERGRSLVIVSHLFHDRAQLDRILLLRRGRLEAA